MTDNDRREEIREKKRKQLKQQAENNQQPTEEEIVETQREQQKEQRDALVRKLLTSDALKRLNTVEMRGDEERVEKIKNTLVQLSQSGRLNGKITDEQMREMLVETSDDSDDYNIKGMSARRNNE